MDTCRGNTSEMSVWRLCGDTVGKAVMETICECLYRCVLILSRSQLPIIHAIRIVSGAESLPSGKIISRHEHTGRATGLNYLSASSATP